MSAPELLERCGVPKGGDTFPVRDRGLVCRWSLGSTINRTRFWTCLVVVTGTPAREGVIVRVEGDDVAVMPSATRRFESDEEIRWQR